MTPGSRRLSVLVLSGALWVATAHAQELAYLRAASARGSEATGSQGSAWLFNRGGVCYAATPRHILFDAGRRRDYRYARVVVVRPGRTSREAQADRCAVFADHDLALMRVSGISDLVDCGDLLVGQTNIDPLLAGTTQASLMTATSSGSFERSSLSLRSARVSDSDHFWVAAAADRDRLTEGMSGGRITMQDMPAGILLAVNGEGTENPGMAKVLRIDRAVSLLIRLFENSSTATVDDPACLLPIADGRPPRTSATKAAAAPGRRGNLADQGCGAIVGAWSAPPVSENFRPDHLVGTAGASGLWRVTPAAEVTVDVQLCGDRPTAISRLRLDASACPPGDNENYDVEAIVLSSLSVPIASLGFAKAPQSGSVEISSGGSIVGRSVRLRFVARRQSSAPICAGPLLVN